MTQQPIFTESEKVELKQKLNDSLPKEIVAFLNTNGGTVFIGVEDNGTICGVENLDDNLKKIADIIDDQIMPDARQFIELGTKYIDNKHIIEIKIQKGNALFYIKKYGRSSQGCFVRSGSTSRAMSEKQIETTHNKFLNLKNKITEIPTRQKNLTFQYLKLLLVEKGLTINETTFAENFHLLTSGGEYNKMAEFLADKNEVSIKVVRFKGRNKAGGIISRNEYGEKCLVVAMKQAFDYCADVINETRTHFNKGERVDTPLFDRDAFRETWFNACLHNNWIDGTPPAIYIYSNRMEIISTGGLPENLSQDDFFRGVSKPVNEELARLFIRLDLMEQTGYGVPMITERYGKNIFEFLDFFLRVSIPFAFEIEFDENGNVVPKGTTQDSQNDTINDTINKTIQATTQDTQNDTQDGANGTQNGTQAPQNGTQDGTHALKNGTQDSDLDIWIIEQIRQNPKITTEELAQLSGKGLRTIKRHIAKIACIQYIGSGYSGHWEITQ